jgi:hypothetical protein
VRWFQLAATKGDCRAEAVLGDMLFQGQRVPRQAARGLMLLTLSRDCAGPKKRGSSRFTTMPSVAPATTNGQWRWYFLKTGSRAAEISRGGGA